MGRDWEAHVYFEHRPLTAALLTRLLARLAGAGLRLGAPPDERYPALSGFRLQGSRPAVVAEDLETLLRGKEPPVGAGYGIMPFLVEHPAFSGDSHAFLTFARPDPSTRLDGATLVVDGAAFRPDEATALDTAFEWFALLCDALAAVYAWADWETATFLVAAPSRRDVRAGRIPRLMRFNAIRRDGQAAVDGAALDRTARVRRVGDLVLFERGSDQ